MKPAAIRPIDRVRAQAVRARANRPLPLAFGMVSGVDPDALIEARANAARLLAAQKASLGFGGPYDEVWKKIALGSGKTVEFFPFGGASVIAKSADETPRSAVDSLKREIAEGAAVVSRLLRENAPSPIDRSPE